MAVDAAKEIESSGKKARVVSAVCWELFEDQDESYKNSILPPDVTARVRCTPLDKSQFLCLLKTDLLLLPLYCCRCLADIS